MADIKEILLASKVSRIGTQAGTPVRKDSTTPTQSFDQVLDQADLHISKHASKRLEARQIELSSMDRQKLSSAMDSLKNKGARDSLVLMGDLAFVVNVPSKTVVTAMSKDQMKEQIFTNIDSTMLV